MNYFFIAGRLRNKMIANGSAVAWVETYYGIVPIILQSTDLLENLEIDSAIGIKGKIEHDKNSIEVNVKLIAEEMSIIPKNIKESEEE